MMRTWGKGLGVLLVWVLLWGSGLWRLGIADAEETARIDVSAQVAVTFAGIRFNRVTQTFDTVATLTHTGSESIQAPLELHLTSITPDTITLANPSGTASDGHPYVAVPLPTGELAPGATVTNVVLRFSNPTQVHFNFSYHVMGTLAAGNAPPVAEAGPDQTAPVGMTVTLDGSGSTDADGDDLTYAWTLPTVPAGSTATLADATTVNPRLTLDRPGDYTAQLVVNDGQADSAPDTVTVSTENTPPVADAGPDQSAPVNTLVTLDGSASSDVDGDALTFAWTLVNPPAGSTAVLAEATTVHPRLTLDQAGTYTVQLLVNDGQADSAPDSVTLSTENSPPVAEAGPAQTVPLGATVQLDGSGSSDADGDGLTYQWTLTTVPLGSTAALTNPTMVNPSFIADQPGAYVAQLIVNDGTGPSSPDTVTISTENSKPVANAGPDQQVDVGDTVRLDGSGSSDADGDPLTYQWALTTQPVGSTAVLQNANQVLAQFIPDLAGSYIAQLMVSDGVLTSDPDTATVTVTVPPPVNQAPQVTVTATPDTITLPIDHVTLNGTVTDEGLPNPPGVVTRTWTQDSGPGTVTFADAHAEDTTATFSMAGDYVLRLTANDSEQSAFATVTVTVHPEELPPLPPDPETVAPPVDATVVTTTSAATEFLYTGTNPIQTGVAPGTIEAKRAAVLRGQVLDKENHPLPAVVISVLNHPEFGQTLSRADGWFDLAVNGGGLLTLVYAREGYLPAQRQAQVPWQDYVIMDDVVLIPRDRQVTTLTLGAATLQAAQGSLVTDQDGTRQPALLMPAGTTASRIMPDGSTQPLSTLSLRFTEYTVGENGPQTMPAPLPPTSGYTYAVEISADEAPTKVNGQDVVFSQPVSFYVDNFLDFPVGGEVPVGYYDSTKGAWTPVDNGRIVQILSITNGLAQLDLDGSGQPADAAALAALGITDDERAQLATLYPVGRSLWRVSLTHLSTWDCNWPFGPPDGANSPDGPSATTGNKPGTGCPSEAQGSIIGCETQTLGEQIPLAGTGLTLNYRSDRTLGRTTAHTLHIPLSGSTLPTSLKRIELEVTVAGRVIHEQSYPAQTGQTVDVTWDGLDAYGRPVQGTQIATVTLNYVYDGVYQRTTRFGHAGNGLTIEGSRTRQEVYFLRRTPVRVTALDFRQVGLGGWSLDVHHIYDPIGQTLYQGNGSRRSVTNLLYNNIITTVAGSAILDSDSGFSGDGGPATQAKLANPSNAAVGPDGSLYIVDYLNSRIRRVGLDGIITTVAGNGALGFSGDGGPATQAGLYYPDDVAVGPDGSLYIADTYHHRIRRVGPDGIITTVAGNGASGFSGDGGPATQASLHGPAGIAVAPDGSLYIADSGNRRVRWVRPDGTITTVAGSGQNGYDDDGRPATQAKLSSIKGVAVGPDGSLYIADTYKNRVCRVGLDGILTTVAGPSGYIWGSGGAGLSGDGGPATQARFNLPWKITVGLDGSLYIADYGNHRIRRVGPDGITTTVAGTRLIYGISGDGGPATQAALYHPQGVAVGPDDSLYLADSHNQRVRRIGPALPGFNGTDLAMATPDGRQLDRFNSEGRHLSTVDTLTGATRYTFGYDSTGWLTSITDADGQVTTIERDSDGQPTALVAPFGQRTTLTVDSHGYLASVTNPAGEAYQMQSTADGLLTRFENPRGYASTFTYDALGRLEQDANAASGRQTLSRTELANGQGFTVARTTALNRTTTYTLEDLSTGDQQRTVTTPDGLTTTTVERTDGGKTVTAPDGMILEALEGPDPRFGMQAPLTTEQTITTGGLTATVNRSATVSPVNPPDPLTFDTLTDTTTVNGRTTTQVYTAATRRTDTTSPAGRQRYAILDAQGRVIERGLTGIAPVRLSYNAQGQLIRIAQGSSDERLLTLDYATSGDLSQITDALNHSQSYTHDPVGRVLTQTRADGHVLNYAYDANGNPTALTPPGQPAHGFTYTPVDRVAGYAPPPVTGGGDTGYTDNADQQLTQITRPDGGVLTFDYDAAGRLRTLTTPVGPYGYTYHAAGQLHQITAPGSVVLDYSYSGALPTEVAWSGPLAGRVGYGYDNDFQVNAITVNGQDPIAYQYDPDRLLIQAGELTLTRDPQNGLLTSATLGHTTESHAYNAFGEVQQSISQVDGTTLLDLAYTYDRLGRITQKTETLEGVTTVYAYTYDAIGQLTEVKQDGTVTATYTYDANGNRLTGPGINDTGAYDAQDRLLSDADTTYTHGANGELQSQVHNGQTTTYAYDALGNLRHVTLPNGDTLDYRIDGQNRRIGKQVNGVLTQGFLYQGQLQPAAELDGSGHIVSRFVYATGINVPDYLIKNGQTYRLFTDHLGSPRLVVNTTTGAVEQRLDYDADGNVLQDTNPGFQPFGFAGGLYDRDTGLVRFGARDYDPQTGRWTAKDPILFAGGDANLYRYVANDPINWKDPAGEVGLVGAGYGAIAGAIGGYISGGFEGALTGAVAGAIVGSINPFASSAVGAAIGAGAASLVGQLTGNIVAGKSLSDPGNYDATAAIGAAIGGAAGGPINHAISRFVGPYRSAVIGSEVGARTISRTPGMTTGSIAEGIAVGVGELAGKGRGKSYGCSR
ncbi:MAG: hypothetical protein H6974_11225 [Gammaproteobacteria bacterium]|nr:hypothetical protein [Gammaproteobacteria bacterium]